VASGDKPLSSQCPPAGVANCLAAGPPTRGKCMGQVPLSVLVVVTAGFVLGGLLTAVSNPFLGTVIMTLWT
jgi:hypothetical protein